MRNWKIVLIGGLALLPMVAAVAQERIANPPFRTMINQKDGADMVWIPAGSFWMGDDDMSDNPRRRVRISGFWMYKCPVTVAMYRKFTEKTNRTMPPAPDWGWKEDHPMVNVNWMDANNYCRWAEASLPTEAQWEKAARGVDANRYPWGNEFDSDKLWKSTKSTGDAKGTAPVGSLPAGASPYGLMDMVGNVWQWCRDWYDEVYMRSVVSDEPADPDMMRYRVQRGGAWNLYEPIEFRTGHRGMFNPAFKAQNFGFRPVIR